MELDIKYFEDGKEDINRLKCRLIDVCHRYISGEKIETIVGINTEESKKRYEILKKYVSAFDDKKA